MKVSVLGCGTWGSAIAQSLADNGAFVTAWQRYEEKSKDMESTRKHPILKNIEFNNNINFTSNLDEAINNGNLIFLAIPSHAIRTISSQISKVLKKDSILVNLAKGIESDTLMTMSQVIIEENNICLLYTSPSPRD